jgi:PAS domain S-box-containing protein
MNKESDYSKVVALSGWAILLLGLLALSGWILKFPILSSFGGAYIPMAPSTAIITIFFGSLLMSGAYKPDRVRFKGYMIAGCGLLSLYGFIIFLDSFGISYHFIEDFLFPGTFNESSFPIIHMSPYSGLLFFCCGIAFVINSLFAGRKNLPNIISSLGLTVAFAGFVAVLGYSFGTPFLYGGNVIPVAMPTSFVFLLLGLALIGIAGPKGIYLRQFIGNSTSARVLRAILPVVLSAIIFEDLLDNAITDNMQINPALLMALLTIFFSVVTTFVVVRLTKNIFQRAEKTEHEMELQKLRFQQLFENSPIGIAMLDKDEKVLAINKSFQTIFQFTIDEIRGMSINESIVPDSKLQESFELKTKSDTGKKTDLETVRKRKDGSLVPVHIFGVPVSFDENRIGLYGIYIDITDRKLAEETLSESEERFRSIFMNSTIGIYQTSRDGEILLANPTLVEMLGYESFEKLKSRNLTDDYYDPEYQRSDFIQKIEQTGTVKGLESAWKRVDNSILMVRESARIIRNNEGQILYYEGVVEDITESKRRELEMQIQWEIGHSVSNTSNSTELMSLIHDSLRKVVYAENCFFALYDENTGFYSFPYYVDQFDSTPAPDPMPKSCTSYIFRTGKSLIVTSQVFQQLKEQNEVELNGTLAHSWIGVPLKTASKVIGVLVLQHYQKENVYNDNDLRFLDSIARQIANVIERKQAEEELHKSQQLIEGIINAISVRVFWKDKNSVYLGCNAVFARDAGFSDPKELIGKDDFQMGWRDQAELYRSGDRQVMESGENILLNEEPQTTPEGKTIILLTNKIPLRNSLGEIYGILGTSMNITDRIAAVQEIKHKNEELQKLNAEKDKFFSIIAHDLKTPFNSIIGFSEILVKQVMERNFEGIEDYSNIILNSSQRAMNLLMNLMEWSRSQTGRMEFSPQYLDIDVLINDATELLSEVAHQKSIAISRELPRNIRVFVDKAMIDTLLRNLISNAIKFTNPGGTIVVSAEQKQDEVMVTVSDNGVGINTDAMGKLFRIEESYSTKGTQNEQGTGLGLILCKEFIEKHGGEIWAESEVGIGSKFCFTIPKV